MKIIKGITAVFCGAMAACAPSPEASLSLNEEPRTALSSQVPALSERLFLKGFFPIGVFAQPEQSFAKWKSRGINTVLETPQGHDPVSWDKAAQAAGFKIIRRPMADPKQDIGRTDLLAWSHWDEPDAAGRAPQWTPLFEKTAAEWRKLDPNRRIFINFAGPDLSWFTTRSDSYSLNYASHYPRLLATADWIANDLYPSGGWLNDAHKARRGDVTLITEPLKILKKMTDKPLFAFIEASEIEKGNVPGARCPTPDEMRAQIWLAVIHGCRGLFYFPAVVGTNGFQFDGAPPAIVTEMTKQNALLASVGPLLQGEINPKEITVNAPGLEAGWRRAGKSLLVILVNPRPTVQQARIRITGVRAAEAQELVTGRRLPITDQFREDLEPYGVRLLQFGQK